MAIDSADIKELAKLLRQELAGGFSEASRGARDFGDELGELSGIQKELKKTYIALSTTQKNNTSEVKKLSSEIEKLWGKLYGASEGLQRYKLDMEKHNKAIRHAINAQKNYCERLRDVGEHYGKLIGLGVNLGASFGAQSISLRKLVSSVKDYNENLFKIQRTQQVFGRGVGDLDKAFSVVSKQTTLSRVQFLQFANVMMDGYKGIKPSAIAMADFAAVIQKQFNPTLEETIRVGKEFLDIYSKFPVAAEAIKDAMELATKGNITEQEKKRLNNAKAMTLTMRVQGEMSEDASDTWLKAMEKTTKQQQAVIDANRKLNKSSAQVEDAMLEVGKKSEGALKLAADATTLLYTGLQNVAGAAAIATASIAALNLQASAMSTISMMGGLGGGFGGGSSGGKRLPGSMTTFNYKKSLRGGGGGGGSPSGFGGMNVQGGGTTPPSRFTGMSGAGGMMRGFGTMSLLAGAMSGYGAYTSSKAKEDPSALRKGLFRGGVTTAGTMAGAALGSLAGPVGTMAGGALGGMAFDKIGELLENKIFPKAEDLAGANKEIGDELVKQVQAYQKEVISNKYVLDASEKLAESTRARLDLIIQLNQSLRSEGDLLGKQVMDYENQASAADKVLSNINVIYGNIMKMSGINWFPDKNLDNIQNAQNAVQAMSSGLKNLDIEMAGTDPKNEEKMRDLTIRRNTLMKAQGDIQKTINERNKASMGYVKSSVDKVAASAKQEEEMNSVYSERLAVQRQLMETAQFGFGASVAMLQQQVDLEYELMGVQQDRMKGFRQTISQQKLLTKEQITQLEGARSFDEAQNMITKSFGKTGDQAKVLINLSQDFQKAQSETMKHQQKIYELTKEMREGYMDAFREMSANVGEFSKIIGTQETGMTQLMKTVEDVTGERKLNTMKGGVMVEAGMGGYEARMTTAGAYTVGGGQFKGQAGWEAMNQDIYGYGRTPTGRPVAGGAVTDFMKDGGAGAFRDALDKTPAGDQNTMAAAVRDGVIAARDNVFINPSVAAGIPLGGELGPTNAAAHGAKLVDFSRGVAGAATGADPARNVPPLYRYQWDRSKANPNTLSQYDKLYKKKNEGGLTAEEQTQYHKLGVELDKTSLTITKLTKAQSLSVQTTKNATVENVKLLRFQKAQFERERSWRQNIPERFSSSRERMMSGGGVQIKRGRRKERVKIHDGWSGRGFNELRQNRNQVVRRAIGTNQTPFTQEQAIAAATSPSRVSSTSPVEVNMFKSDQEKLIAEFDRLNKQEAALNKMRKYSPPDPGIMGFISGDRPRRADIFQTSDDLREVTIKREEIKKKMEKNADIEMNRRKNKGIEDVVSRVQDQGRMSNLSKTLAETSSKARFSAEEQSTRGSRTSAMRRGETEAALMGITKNVTFSNKHYRPEERGIYDWRGAKTDYSILPQERGVWSRGRKQASSFASPATIPAAPTQTTDNQAKAMASAGIQQQMATMRPVANVAEMAKETMGWSGSGGTGKLIVYLSDDLKGKTESLSDLQVEIRKASG